MTGYKAALPGGRRLGAPLSIDLTGGKSAGARPATSRQTAGAAPPAQDRDDDDWFETTPAPAPARRGRAAAYFAGGAADDVYAISFGAAGANGARDSMPGGAASARTTAGGAAGVAAPLTAEERCLPLEELALRRVFGIAAFRPQQRDIVAAALAGQDVFVLMPTGGGKSLCFQVVIKAHGNDLRFLSCVAAAQAGQDVFVPLPTGGGKRSAPAGYPCCDASFPV